MNQRASCDIQFRISSASRDVAVRRSVSRRADGLSAGRRSSTWLRALLLGWGALGLDLCRRFHAGEVMAESGVGHDQPGHVVGAAGAAIRLAMRRVVDELLEREGFPAMLAERDFVAPTAEAEDRAHTHGDVIRCKMAASVRKRALTAG